MNLLVGLAVVVVLLGAAFVYSTRGDRIPPEWLGTAFLIAALVWVVLVLARIIR